MDDRLERALRGLLIDSSSISLPKLAVQNTTKQERLFKNLLENPTLPQEGLNESTLEFILCRLAAMDANNNPDGCGVGEREGRIYSSLVRRRHWGLAHGIGRSGNLFEIQPKAPGSAVIQRITDKLVRQAIKISGIQLKQLSGVTVLPVATGMALSFVLRAISSSRPGSRYVLMPRIDQKSCIKCVAAAGLELIILENQIIWNSVCTDLDALEIAIKNVGEDKIAAIISTSSCFAPRVCDSLVEIGQICQSLDIPHLVNNAYGLQSTLAVTRLNQAIQKNLVTAIVQSTDKNFMVPVGGSIIIASPDLCTKIASLYPGRASLTPVLDVFITLLSMGIDGYRNLLAQRQDCFKYFISQLKNLEASCPLRVLETPLNDISISIALDSNVSTWLGSKLFVRSVSGARIVTPTSVRLVDGVAFTNFGSHCSNYPHTYLTVASAIGQTRREIDLFLERLRRALKSKP